MRLPVALVASFLLLAAPVSAQAPQETHANACASSAALDAHDTPAWASFRCAWENVDGYSATVTMTERVGTDVQTSVSTFTFRKPGNATLSFTTGKNAGVTLVWAGGDDVVAHRGSGLMSLFKKTFALHDPQMTTIRGSSIDELSFAAVLMHAQTTPGTMSQESGPLLAGIATEAVSLVPQTPSADGGLTLEVADLAPGTDLPLRILGYEGSTLVRQLDFSDLTLLPSEVSIAAHR
jgi:hypothetical protein